MSKERLWEKGGKLNQLVHEFTVGSDPFLDKLLLRYDAIASAAHARMLEKIGVIDKKECSSLLKALSEVVTLADKGEFEIPHELEDGHTAIEVYLVDKCGDAGKKIHTARSRNDQVLVAQRLYLKSQVFNLLSELKSLAEVLANRYGNDGKIPLPGYTHFQAAMPASMGMWFHSFLELTLDNIREGFSLLNAIDANPLGVASGFSVPLEVDRAYTTELLGFSRTQRGPIAVQNSRGFYELKVLRWTEQIAQLIEKVSWDLILYSTKEFGFISLPDEFTTGSSIMPQKKNPDVLELLRAKAAVTRACAGELSSVVAKLPSNYHRDLQLTKEPMIRGISTTLESLVVLAEVVKGFSVNADATKQAMTADLYATYDAYQQVREGKPFREAYKSTAKKYADGKIDVEALTSEYQYIEKQVEGEFSEGLKELSSLLDSLDAKYNSFIKIEESVFAL